MTPRVKRYSRLLRKVPLLMVAELTVLLVRMYTELSSARTLVERKLMSTTSPETSPTEIQSPMEKGRSSRMTSPLNRFLALSCAAREIVRPTRPALATMLPTGRPVSCAMVIMPRTTMRTLYTLFSRVVRVRLARTSSPQFSSKRSVRSAAAYSP